MKGLIVNVATDSWCRGQRRLRRICDYHEQPLLTWTQALPKGSPPHRDGGFCPGAKENCRPYAFKAYALREAADRGHKLLLWADASVVPLCPLDSYWERRNKDGTVTIERSLWGRIQEDGYWMCRNGYSNAEWTADSAYPDLFQDLWQLDPMRLDPVIDDARAINKIIPHVVATAFGLNLDHPKGRAFLDEYFRLASQTKAFCGPWRNTNAPAPPDYNPGLPAGPCGPPSTRGHRHDQTAASVIAWRLGFVLDEPPKVLAYEGGEVAETMLAVRKF